MLKYKTALQRFTFTVQIYTVQAGKSNMAAYKSTNFAL